MIQLREAAVSVAVPASGGTSRRVLLHPTTLELDERLVAVIGANGSGKSTLLLALAGILQPTEGVVEVSGHVSTLLSLNAGFDAELTGRENIALAGALMGIDEAVMKELTPGIIKFANVGAFIDAPLKTYSSGMRARVGFAIATSVTRTSCCSTRSSRPATTSSSRSLAGGSRRCCRPPRWW